MQIVIDIDEEKYEWLKENNPKADKISIVGTIIQGTPLPKGHGRLGDLDALEKEIENYSKGAFAMTPEFLVKDAPTIIDADKSESEDTECR